MNNSHFNTGYLILLILIFILSSMACSEKKNGYDVREKINKSKGLELKKSKISPYEILMTNQGLVNLKKIDSTLLIDLKYSTKDNFFGEDVYGNFNSAFLQVEPAKALKIANDYLKELNDSYRLVIYDATRPHSVQVILWEKLDSIPPKTRKNFVADPEESSIHNYGCAVDLSIFDLKANKPLDMGTKFDYFGDLAYPRLESLMLKSKRLTKTQLENRKLLRLVMKKANYDPISSEWWHFNYYSRKKAKELFEIIK